MWAIFLENFKWHVQVWTISFHNLIVVTVESAYLIGITDSQAMSTLIYYRALSTTHLPGFVRTRSRATSPGLTTRPRFSFFTPFPLFVSDNNYCRVRSTSILTIMLFPLPPSLDSVNNFFLVLNSSINFVIYCLTGRTFRMTLIRLFTRR